MTEHQGTNHLFLSILILHGINHHRVGGTDALVATATVAHHRNHGATHTGIAGRSGAGDDMREDVVAKDAMTQRTVHRLAQAMTIIALDRLLGSLHIIFLGLEDERDFIKRSGGSKLIDHREIELDIIISLITLRSIPLIEDHITIALHIHEVGMRTGDDGCGLCIICIAAHLDIEFIHISLLQLDVDVGILDKLLALLQTVGSQILEHLEFILRLSDESTERYGDRQAYHTRARNTYTHGILEHVRTQEHLDTLRALAQSGGSLSCTESHRHRFGTTDGRHYFLVDERDDALTLIFL